MMDSESMKRQSVKPYEASYGEIAVDRQQPSGTQGQEEVSPADTHDDNLREPVETASTDSTARAVLEDGRITPLLKNQRRNINTSETSSLQGTTMQPCKNYITEG